MKIGIGNDHAAVDMKNEISEYLKEKGYEVVNYGTDSNESCDYPVYGEKVGEAVAHGDVDLGILICGTGVGISLAANKVEGIRAVVCSEPYTAKLSAHEFCIQPLIYDHLSCLDTDNSCSKCKDVGIIVLSGKFSCIWLIQL